MASFSTSSGPDGSPDVDGAAFAAFAARLGAQVDMDLRAATPASSLRDELGFDSLAMAEALLVLADAGADLPTDLIPELHTLGDLFHYATVLAPRPEEPASGPVRAPAGEVRR
jgi:acyl carrier protein